MAHGYTPGLTVTPRAAIVRRRLLPIPGEVLVHRGQRVSPGEIVAHAVLPGDVYPLNVANLLGVSGAETPKSMLVKQGDHVVAGQVIAAHASFFGMFRSEAISPRDGIIESVSAVTGQVIIRGAPQPVTVAAYLDGVVDEELPGQGVTVRCAGAFIQGIFGVGGETSGPIRVCVSGPAAALQPEDLDASCAGSIVIGGRWTSVACVRRARELGVRAVVTGGFDDADLRELLGYEQGVAITGAEALGLTVLLTEGFGEIAMARRTFDLLQRCEGRLASLNGATQIRAGVLRPEIIIADTSPGEIVAARSNADSGSLSVGDQVRCIRAPRFGRIGIVSGLPSDPVRLPSGAVARVLELRFADGETARVPRANVERISFSDADGN